MSLPKGSLNRSNFNAMKTPFLMIQAHHDDFNEMSAESVRGVQQETILSKLFFSKQNVEIIQKMIKKSVFIKSNKEFLLEDNQNPIDLQIVMRAIFLQNAKHLPEDITGQIRELNFLVVDDVVPNIISEIRAHIGYLDRVFNPRQIIDRPQNVSNAGTRTLPSITTRFA